MLMLPVIFLGWVLAIAVPAVLLFGCVKLFGIRLVSQL